MIEILNDEVLKPKEKKKIKPTTIIIIAIILLSILCIISMVGIVYIKSVALKITLDGQDAQDLEELFIMQENNKIYIPIRRMAQHLKYESYSGDYKAPSEDTTKCYIKSEEETVAFTQDSNIIIKVTENQTQQIKIAEPIQEINGELCITSEGAQDAFNLKFYNNINQDNSITIETLSYLYNAYSNYYSVNKGYLLIEEESFANKTAILDDMLIVQNENEYYGVISTNGETILEPKYDDIQYFRKTAEFLVESNNKKGIITKEKEDKVKIQYDNIEKVTNKDDVFYVVEKSSLYGLLDKNGDTIIHPEYEKIGIDISNFEENGVTSGYILYNEIVPVQRDSKWALFNTKGEKITEFVYDSFGCAKNKTRTYGVLIVPEYNLIVAKQGEKYNLIKLNGKELFKNYVLDSVYITISEGQNIYYITNGEIIKELISFLEENKIEKPTPIQ